MCTTEEVKAVIHRWPTAFSAKMFKLTVSIYTIQNACWQLDCNVNTFKIKDFIGYILIRQKVQLNRDGTRILDHNLVVSTFPGVSHLLCDSIWPHSLQVPVNAKSPSSTIGGARDNPSSDYTLDSSPVHGPRIETTNHTQTPLWGHLTWTINLILYVF